MGESLGSDLFAHLDGITLSMNSHSAEVDAKTRLRRGAGEEATFSAI
jgi:hypothetical protein